MASPWQIRQAAFYLRAGGVIAYPTETVYGLGCDPLDGDAVQQILELKKRPKDKGLILIASDLHQLLPFVDLDDDGLKRLAEVGERPTTWICPKRPNTPNWLCGRFDSIAVRISSSPIARALCARFGGAIVSTSANPAGLEPARSLLTVRHYFGDLPDYILGGPIDPAAKPSRIIDIHDGRVIRD